MYVNIGPHPCQTVSNVVNLNIDVTISVAEYVVENIGK